MRTHRGFPLLPLAVLMICVTARHAPAADLIPWADDLSAAFRTAEESNKLVLLHFSGEQCPPCMRLETKVYSDAIFVHHLTQKYVPVKINATASPDVARQWRVESWPTDILLAPDGRELFRMTSPLDTRRYLTAVGQVAWRFEELQGEGTTNDFAPANLSHPYHREPEHRTNHTNMLAQHTSASAANEAGSTPPPHSTPPPTNAPSHQLTSLAANPNVQSSLLPQRHSAGVPDRAPVGQVAAEAMSPDTMSPDTMSHGTMPQHTLAQHTTVAPYPGYDQENQAAWGTAASGNASTPNPSMIDNLYVSGGSPTFTVPAPSAAPFVSPGVLSGAPIAAGDPPQVRSNAVASTTFTGNVATDTAGEVTTPHQNQLVTAQMPAASPRRGLEIPVNSGQQSPPKNSDAAIALNGFCCVTLMTENRWVAGDTRWGARHRGQIYLFQTAAAQQQFLAEPDKYGPMMSGFDPVVYVETGLLRGGSRAHGVRYQDRMYLFTSEEALRQFWSAPWKYADAAERVMRVASSP